MPTALYVVGTIDHGLVIRSDHVHLVQCQQNSHWRPINFNGLLATSFYDHIQVVSLPPTIVCLHFVWLTFRSIIIIYIITFLHWYAVVIYV